MRVPILLLKTALDSEDWREANVVPLFIADSWGHVGNYRLDISGHPEARDVDEIQYK